ncbi:MAG: peptide-methionine (R)-S-oxide reductase MsrB, partial [Janthinobacterium lividum]
GGATLAPFNRTDAQWREMLSADQYDILRREGTERAFSSALNDETRAGMYACAGCRQEVFSSEDKFDSGTGWPSFTRPIPGSAEIRYDTTVNDTLRTEVHCVRCESHLGHVFEDGPPPTGLRYRINGLSLRFIARQA